MCQYQRYRFIEARWLKLVFAASLFAASAVQASAVEIVSNGQVKGTIVIVQSPSEEVLAKYSPQLLAAKKGPGPKKGKKNSPEPITGPDAEAAKLLADWIAKMTGAEMPIAEQPAAGTTPIYVGYSALQAGLKVDDIESPSREGVRISSDAKQILIGGQTSSATYRGVCRFLEEFGCRVFMDGEIGEVYPSLKTLDVKSLAITEKPGFLFRNPKGPSWRSSVWRAWNGGGGTAMGHSHSWGGYVPPELFKEHPEFFAMKKDGQRTPSGWLCTSNPALREFFANKVIERIKAGEVNPSLSPSDGTAYCQCERCLAQDDPRAVEPSSGAVAMSNRYVNFFDDVARRVAKVYPDSILSFYCYADYTQPPTSKAKLSPNLCAFIAPIRYCRLHGIGDEICPQRVQQKQMIDGWAQVASKLGYYMYMYDLAETTVPVSFLSRLKRDIPYLHRQGCVGMTQEVLTNWHLYGPSMHLANRLMYDPTADADAIMADYFEKFYGPAAPHMKEYWSLIDEAVAHLDCHSGSFFWIHLVYTPEFLQRLNRSLQQAAAAVKDQPRYAERVALHAAGYQSAVEYTQMREAMIRGDFVQATAIFSGFVDRVSGLAKKGWVNPEYGTAYMKRFNGHAVDLGAKLTAAPNRLLQVLPDEWRMMYDTEQQGIEKKFHEPNLDDANWKKVATYGKTLSAQGMPDRTEVLWYRTSFDLAKKPSKLSLMFGEVDGLAEVFVNGQKVAAPGATSSDPFKRRAAFEVDVSTAAKAGKNIVSVRVDHTRITELNLGGIIRPVYLIEKAE